MAAQANSVSLVWDPNPEADLAGYKVYTGTSPGAYTQTFDVGHKTTHSVADLEEGETYYFVVTAYDIYGNESDYSTEISTTISVYDDTLDAAEGDDWSYWWNLLFSQWF